MFSTCLTYFNSFFFKHYADHRLLPSFPTRRSSDLDVEWPRGEPLAEPLRDDDLERVAGEDVLAGRFHAMVDAAREHIRSEEHTSELQSRRDLVCRLLLEKKKKQKE